MFAKRVDKTILWPIYCNDDKLFAKYSRDKFKLTKHSVSPFVNWSSLQKEILAQKESFSKRMKAVEAEGDYFNMIFKECDEDDSDNNETAE